MQNNGRNGGFDRRGKWQPFDALEGYSAALRQVEKKKDKIEKPVLFPDELETLNDKLYLAYSDRLEVLIKYFSNGYILEVQGIVTKIDMVNKEITIKSNNESLKIKFNMITKIKEVDY